MANLSISGSGHNSTVTLLKIHQGGVYFKKDTATTHSQVELIQEKLTLLGYDTQGADGIYGSNTTSAVKEFQTAQALDADGLFGKASLEALEAILGEHLDPDNCTNEALEQQYSITATVETTKNGSGGYLNMRNSAASDASVVTTIPNGSTVQVQTLNGTWLPVLYNGYTGYVMGKFIMEAEAYGGNAEGDTGDGTTEFNGTPTYGKVQCNDYITVRPTPSTDATGLGRIRNGQQVVYYAGEIHTSSDGDEFYRIDFDGIGYVLKQYIVDDTSDRSVVATFNFDPDAAVLYGYNHTLDNRDTTEPSNNNGSFGFTNNGNCANFVSQCLCAGGLPMFSTWSRSITGVPFNSEGRYNWNHTNATRCALMAKGRITRISCADVKKGDIIYNYDVSESNEYGRYDHVVIAAQDYNASSKSCIVHGHTQNVRDYKKYINDTDHRCYRVVSPIKVEACEYQIDMPVSGDGGAAI